MKQPDRVPENKLKFAKTTVYSHKAMEMLASALKTGAARED
jgi:hypothetical protein